MAQNRRKTLVILFYRKIMIRIIFCLLLVSCIKISFSQETNLSTLSTQKSVVRLHIVVPGLLLEQRIGDNKSIVFDIASGFYYYQTSFADGTKESDLILTPHFRIEPRSYFNLENRAFRGKRTDYYSGQYLGLQLLYGIPTEKVYQQVSVGGLWGFQCTLGKRGYLDLGIGAGLTIYDNTAAFVPLGNLGIGFILN